MNHKKIIVAGGSGFLGQHLLAYFSNLSYEVLILSRGKSRGVFRQWDAKTLGAWAAELEGAQALINMTGRTVDCRYNEKNKAQILNSRIDSTRILGEAVRACTQPPKFWFNSSTATIYQHTEGNAPANTEKNGIVGSDFSMNVAKAWEAEFFSHDTPDTIKTALRTAIAMGKDGGAFPVMAKLAKFGLCSPQGTGKQWISWVHVEDVCRVIEFLMQQPHEGIVNVAAPYPIQNQDFNRLLKEKLNVLFTLPQPEWLLKIGAFFIRTQTELILKSRKAYPEHLLDAGFTFNYEKCDAALDDLLA